MARIHSRSYLVKRKKKISRVAIFSIACVIILFIGSIVLAHNEKFIVNDINISGAYLSDTERIKEISEGVLSGKYLFLYPHSNIFIYPKERIAHFIYKQFPQIKNVEFEREGNTLFIFITEREPYGIVCGATEECNFLDSEGYVFSGAPRFSEDVYPVFNATSTIGEYVMDTEEFKALTQTNEFFMLYGLDIYGYEIAKPMCKVFLEKENTITIVLDCLKDYRVFENDFSSFIADPNYGTTTLSNYQYLDFRLKGKVVVKEKVSE